MQLSELDTVTKNINYCGKLYTFTVYVTAWDKLCMAYANVENPHEDRIFSVVIDPESCYTLIDVNPDGISTVHTPDDAVRHVRKCYELLINGDNDIAELEIAEAELLRAGYEPLELDFEEENNRQPYCEAIDGMIPIVTE